MKETCLHNIHLSKHSEHEFLSDHVFVLYNKDVLYCVEDDNGLDGNKVNFSITGFLSSNLT